MHFFILLLIWKQQYPFWHPSWKSFLLVLLGKPPILLLINIIQTLFFLFCHPHPISFSTFSKATIRIFRFSRSLEFVLCLRILYSLLTLYVQELDLYSTSWMCSQLCYLHVFPHTWLWAMNFMKLKDSFIERAVKDPLHVSVF